MKGALPHLRALDGVRGLAILAVMPHHFRTIIEPTGGVLSYLWVKIWDAGWMGVDLFFVLSGFLITRILLATRDAENYYVGFYGRRALRIWPLYYTVLIAWLVIQPRLWPENPIATIDKVGLLLLISNWVHPFQGRGGGISHYWSLGVEEQFYLLWPLAVRRLSAQGVLKLALAIAGAAPLIRTAMRLTGWGTEAVYQFTVARMDALAFGAAIAAVAAIPSLAERVSRWPLALASLGTLLFGAAVTRGFPQHTFAGQTIGYSLFGLSMSLWVASLVLPGERLDGRRLLQSRLLRTFGKYSYALYLLHVPLGMLIFYALPRLGLHSGVARSVPEDALLILIAGSVVFSAALLSWRFLESPALSQKSRFEPVFRRD